MRFLPSLPSPRWIKCWIGTAYGEALPLLCLHLQSEGNQAFTPMGEGVKAKNTAYCRVYAREEEEEHPTRHEKRRRNESHKRWWWMTLPFCTRMQLFEMKVTMKVLNSRTKFVILRWNRVGCRRKSQRTAEMRFQNFWPLHYLARKWSLDYNFW